MIFQKDGSVFNAAQLKALHPNISFGPNTPAELGYTPYEMPPAPNGITVMPIVSRFQALAALHIAGLLTSVEAAVAQADTLTQLAWANAQEFRRDSAMLLTLAATLGLTDEQLDNLFIAAAQIEA